MVVCAPKETQRRGDSLEIRQTDSLLGATATGWLIEQAIVGLNGTEDRDKARYGQVIEVLRERKDVVKLLTQLAQTVPRGDVPLRWSLLYVLGEVGDADAARFLLKAVVERLPVHDESDGCEGPRDNEVLIRVMAIEAFENIARRHEGIGERIIEVFGKVREPAVVIEAVKAAVRLGLREHVERVLDEGDRWMLDIRTARHSEVDAEAERTDGGERGFVPPHMCDEHRAPKGACSCN